VARRPVLRWIDQDEPLPDPRTAWRDPNGLLAAGRDLSAERLEHAYRRGIFPWYTDGQPVLWWSPDPRMVLFTEEFKCSRSLTKTIRRVEREGSWSISLDRCFEQVMRACAGPRRDQDGTWITRDILDAYCGLHRRGLAHSIEIWERATQRLIGGLYGVSLGRMFFGESMFARETDASKVALAALVHLLRELEIRVIDCQQNTGHLASLGAREIPREQFLQIVAESASQPAPDWRSVDIGFPTV
jgi:leucyl/phenylalanyl-tRNA--protein transferase